MGYSIFRNQNILIHDRFSRLVDPGSKYIPELSAAVSDTFPHKSLGVQWEDLTQISHGLMMEDDFGKELEEMGRIACRLSSDNYRRHLCSTYYLPGTLWCALHKLICLMLLQPCSITILIFQIENWNTERLSYLNQGHTANEWRSYDLTILLHHLSMVTNCLTLYAYLVTCVIYLLLIYFTYEETKRWRG